MLPLEFEDTLGNVLFCYNCIFTVIYCELMKIYKACEKIYPPLNFLQSDFTGFIERADTNVMQLREPSLYLYTVLKAKEQERRKYAKWRILFLFKNCVSKADTYVIINKDLKIVLIMTTVNGIWKSKGPDNIFYIYHTAWWGAWFFFLFISAFMHVSSFFDHKCSLKSFKG